MLSNYSNGLKQGVIATYPALVYQKGPSRRLRTKETALKAIQTLEEHGWLISMSAMELDGNNRREVWSVNHV